MESCTHQKSMENGFSNETINCVNSSQDQKPRLIDFYEKYIEYDKKHPKQRKGQKLYNTLHEIDPTLARKIVGTQFDPFYDTNLDNFYKFLEENFV